MSRRITRLYGKKTDRHVSNDGKTRPLKNYLRILGVIIWLVARGGHISACPCWNAWSILWSQFIIYTGLDDICIFLDDSVRRIGEKVVTLPSNFKTKATKDKTTT